MKEKQTPGRADRKLSYKIPPCNGYERLQFTLLESWEWLGVFFKGEAILTSMSNGTTLTLQGRGLKQANLGGPINDHRQPRNFDWLRLYEHEVASISFCDNATATDRITWDNQTKWSWIHMLAGVKA